MPITYFYASDVDADRHLFFDLPDDEAAGLQVTLVRPDGSREAVTPSPGFVGYRENLKDRPGLFADFTEPAVYEVQAPDGGLMRCSASRNFEPHIPQPASVSPLTVEAVSWLLAARLLHDLPGYRISEQHPGDGQYNVLVLIRDEEAPQVRLNRHGTVQVHRLDGNQRVLAGENVWTDLARGHQSVQQLATCILAEMDRFIDSADTPRVLPEQEAEPANFVADVIAELLRIGALYGWQLQCVAAYHDSSGLEGSYWRHEYLVPFTGLSAPTGDTTSGRNDRDRYWVLLNGDDPIAVFDTTGNLHRIGKEPLDLTALAVERPATTVAGDLFPVSMLSGESQAGSPVPGLGFSAVVEAFNRKERYFLLAAATAEATTHEIHGPSLRPTGQLRRRLADATDWQVPAHAWIGMDYHLAWLHAALQWRSDQVRPGQTEAFPRRTTTGGQALVSGNQEDADLILAWSDPSGDKVILVEAKAYGSWGNSQFQSKVNRIRAILEQLPATDSALQPQVKLVLASPRPPKQIVGVPDFARTAEGHAAWIPLAVPGARLATTRTDTSGTPNRIGDHWKITGPAARP